MTEACSHLRLVPAMLALVVLAFAPGAARGQSARATTSNTPAADPATDSPPAQPGGTSPDPSANALLAQPGHAAPYQDGAAPAVVRVVVAGSEPFVIDGDGGELTGLSLDVWRAAAAELGSQVEIRRAANVGEALDEVIAGRADVAVGPVSITAERAQHLGFTQPYFHSSLGILAPGSGSVFDRIRPFFTTAFITGVGGLLFTLIAVGALIWLAERRENSEQFPRKPLAGIGNGIWMALVTMTTVGYGDRVPRTTLGRVITGLWMLVAVLLFTSMVAFLSTALTLSQLDAPAISKVEDLADRRVAVVEGTTSQRFARKAGARAVPAENLAEAVDLLRAGKADAVIFDKPMLRYYVQQHPELPFQVAEPAYQSQGYGFALPLGSRLRAALDVGILRLQTTGRLETIIQRWLDG